MFASATLKLTGWYLAMVMAISLIFSGVVYHFATDALSRGLHDQSQHIIDEYPFFENESGLRPDRTISAGSRRILANLTYFNIVVLIGAGFASYALARRTLQPIETALTQQKRFTADVSHELRTPLTALAMESEVALMDKQMSKQQLRSALRSNLEETGRLNNLVNNLLRLSNLEESDLQQHFKVIDLKTIMEAAAAQLAAQADSRHIRLDSSQLTSAKVHGDSDSLTQLLVILIDNAIKYSLDNSSVELRAVSQSNRALASVVDTGIGIEKVALAHVFERFYRTDAARSRNDHDGFGLGLSIAKRIADIHDGRLEISSRPGQGTTVTLELPLLVTR